MSQICKVQTGTIPTKNFPAWSATVPTKNVHVSTLAFWKVQTSTIHASCLHETVLVRLSSATLVLLPPPGKGASPLLDHAEPSQCRVHVFAGTVNEMGRFCTVDRHRHHSITARSKYQVNHLWLYEKETRALSGQVPPCCALGRHT